MRPVDPTFGVAYGSDLDKVKEVLLKPPHDHPKVMQEPAPAVFFTTRGQSVLDHELRLYVRELRDRSYTVDELNRAIDRLCWRMTSTLPLTSWKFICAMKKAMKSPK